MKTSHLFHRAGVACLLSVLSLLAWRGEVEAQTVYSWNSSASGDWYITTNWTTTSGTGTTFPGAGDTANLYGTSTTYTADYDALESGSLGTLNMIGISGTAISALNLYTSLTLSAGGSLYDTTATGYEDLTFSADNVVLTIGDGTDAATFTFGNIDAQRYTAQQILLGSTSYTHDKIVVANASTLDWINSIGGASTLGTVPIDIQGTLNLDEEQNGNKNIVLGNLTLESGGKITNSGPYAGNNPLYLGGASIVIDGQITGFTTSQTGNNSSGIVLSNQAAAGGSATQTVSFGTGATAFDLTLRPNAGGAGTTNIENVSSNATGSDLYAATGTNIIDSFNFFGYEVNGNTQVFQLGSNLTFGGTAGPISFETTQSASETITDEVDLNGHTYNMATAGKSFGVSWAGSAGTDINSTGSLIEFMNSAGSASPGTLEATYFNFDNTSAAYGSDTKIGSYVIIQSNNGSTLNDLGDQIGSGTIDPTSTFYFSGGGVSTLISNRNIGNILVGTGTSVSTLSIGSPIIAAGVTTVNANSFLDLYNGTGTGSSGKGTEGSYTLATAGLSGSGTIEDKTIGTGTAISATTLTINNTGATGIPTSNTFSGILTDGGTAAPLSLTLASTNTGTQILSGANTYHGATNVNGGTLLAQNTTGSATGSGSIAVASGAFFGGSGIVNPTGTNTLAVGGTLIAGLSGSSATSFTVSALGTTLSAGTAMVSLAGAQLDFTLGAGNASSYLNLTHSYSGEVSGLSGDTFNFADLTSGNLAPGKYTLILSDSSSANPFQGLSAGVLSGMTIDGLSSYTAAGDTVQLQLNQLTGTNDYALQLDIVAVPEPSTLVLLLAALGGLGALGSARRFRSFVSRCA